MMIMLYDSTIELKNTFTLGSKIKCISMSMCTNQWNNISLSLGVNRTTDFMSNNKFLSIYGHLAAPTTDYQL